MGTRGVIGFRVGGQDKVTYNHWDSYPSSLGVAVLQFIKDTAPIALAHAAERVQLVDDDTKPCPEQVAECRKFADQSVSGGSLDEWYVLLRQTQGDLSAFTTGGLRYMIDSHEFLLDSLFCEYAYIINLDTQCLEVYGGFNHDPKAPGRYSALINDEALQRKMDRGVPGAPFYYGVYLVVEEKLDQLRQVLKAPGAAEKIAEGWQKAIDDIYDAQGMRLDHEAAGDLEVPPKSLIAGGG